MKFLLLLSFLVGNLNAFEINGGGSGGVSAATADADYLNTTGDTATGQINLTSATVNAHLQVATGTVTSTLTIQGNAFSVGTSTFVIVGSSTGFRTANPRTALDVDGAAQFGYSATKSTFSTTGALTLASGAALNASGGAGDIIGQASVTASHVGAQSANFTGSMTCDTCTVSGNAFSVGTSTFAVVGSSIGIGTASPTSRLHLAYGDLGVSTGNVVMGNASNLKWASGGGAQLLLPSGTISQPSLVFAAQTDLGFMFDGGAAIRISGTGGSTSMYISNSEWDLGAPGGGVLRALVATAGSIASPIIHRADDSDTGIFWASGDVFHLITGGVSKLNITADATTVSSSFTVQGTVFSSGTNAGLRISSGTTITNIFKSSFTFDFPNVPAAGTINYGFSTTSQSGGAAVAAGDLCWVEAPALEDDLSVGFASATTASNVLSIRFTNPTAATGIDPGLQLYRYGCIRSAN